MQFVTEYRMLEAAVLRDLEAVEHYDRDAIDADSIQSKPEANQALVVRSRVALRRLSARILRFATFL